MTSEEIKSKQNDLQGFIDTIEAELRTAVDPKNGEDISDRLNARVHLLGNSPEMMAIAVELFDIAKGEAVADAMLKEDFMKAKEHVQKHYLAGKLSTWNALYTRADRCHKDLDKSIEGLRSLLSYDKEMKKPSAYPSTPQDYPQ